MFVDNGRGYNEMGHRESSILKGDYMYQFKLSEFINQEENINVFKYSANDNEQVHTHEFLEIVYVMNGKGQHYINSTCYNVKKGDLLFINFGQSHSFISQGTMEIINCLVSPEFIDRELIHSENAVEILALTAFEDFEGRVDKLIPMISFKGKELIEVERLIECMMNELFLKSTNYKTALRGYLLVLLTKIFREMQKKDYGIVLQKINKITPEILEYIEKNCCEKITLKELAQKCFYNPSYFSRVFKEYYGRNLMDFIHEKRVNEAMRLIRETDMSIESVAYSVGYSDKKQFYKIFKEYIGMTPSQARGTIKK